MGTDGIPLLLLLILCFVLSAYFAATEMALVAMNRIRIKNYADNGDARARRTMQVAGRFEQALTTLLIGNNIVNIVSTVLVTLITTRTFGAASVVWSTLAVTVFIFFFCDMLPKAIAKRRSEDIALWTAPLLIFFMKLLSPLAFVFTKWSNFLKARFSQQAEASYTEEELAEIIETIEDEGVLEPEEQELVQSAFEFQSIQAQDILIPMDKVISLPVNADEEQIKSLMRDNKLSRFPVYDLHRAHVIGLVTANRFYAAVLNGEYRGLRPLLLPIRSFKKSMPIHDLMQEMNARRQHMALIRDEKSRPLGIVTMEDILEELVGEIYDEDDTPPEEPAPEATAEGGSAV